METHLSELHDPLQEKKDQNRKDLCKKAKNSIGGGIAVLIIVVSWLLMAQIIGKIQKESKYQKVCCLILYITEYNDILVYNYSWYSRCYSDLHVLLQLCWFYLFNSLLIS